MQATLPIPAGHCIDAVKLKAQIQACGICFGLDSAQVAEAQHPCDEDRELVIARGQPAQHGTDGAIELLVQTEPKVVAKPDGTIDFKELTVDREAFKGQRLAVYTPPTLGQFGLDIRGTRLDPRPGKDQDFAGLSGSGTLIPPQDRHTLYAARDGVIVRGSDGRLAIVPEFVVDGDVDLRVGNIVTQHPVVIRGDVRKGFKVKSEQNITIGGVIEDARVSAGGNLLVAGGILPGKQRVKARGTIQAHFVHDRNVKAKNLVVAKGIRHSQVQCSRSIRAGNIFGGHLVCGGSLYVNDLGTQHGEHTYVRVGFDPYRFALEAATIVGERVTLDRTGVGLERFQRDDDDEPQQRRRAASASSQHGIPRLPTAEERAIMEALDVLRQEHADPPPGTRIEVNHLLHPPIELWFGGCHKWQTVIPANNVSMVLVEGEIRVLPGLISDKLQSGEQPG